MYGLLTVAFRDIHGVKKIREMRAVPRVGDKVTWDWTPSPRVKDVIWMIEDTQALDVIIMLE